MTNNLTARPLPAPLPYSSQAGRGEIPAAPPAPPVDRDHHDPSAPLMREDDFTELLCGTMVGFFIVVMVIVALMGGL